MSLLIIFGCDQQAESPRDSSSSPVAASAPATTASAVAASMRPQTQRSEPERMNVVSLTPAAAARVEELQRDNAGYDYLRVAVKRGGSTGFMYDLKLDNRVDADADYLGESNGIQIVVDHASMPFLKGASIDWQVTPNGAGFRLDNPNAVQQ